MKYRSPSPVSVDALPTPPHSPRTEDDARANAATNLLNHLQSFYQQEQHWVHHTRAALELAVTKGIDGPAAIVLSTTSNAPVDAASPASSCTSADSPPPTNMSVTIKPDPDGDQLDFELSLNARASRWVRRKNQMRLKLDGISPQHRKRPARAPPSEPGARLLEMFAELVDSRMESCQRISRLVEQAEKRDYCLC